MPVLVVADVLCAVEADNVSYARKAYPGLTIEQIASSVSVLALHSTGPATLAAQGCRVVAGEIALICFGDTTSGRFVHAQ